MGAEGRGLVLVAGATGGLGRQAVAALTASGFAVRALVRNVERARSVFGLEVALIDADVSVPETLPGAVDGVAAIVSAIGGRAPFGRGGFAAIDWHGNAALIDAARRADVRRFLLVTAGSAGRRSFPHRLPIAPYPWKGRAEEHLRRSGLEYTILAPGGLTNDPGGQLGVRVAARERYRVGRISRTDVAAVIVACLGESGTVGRTLTLVNDAALPIDAWRAQLAAQPADSPASATPRW